MKTFQWRILSTLALAALFAAVPFPTGTLRAQAPSGPDTSSSTTEDSTGKVTSVSSSTISVTSRRGPFTYRLGPDLHIIGPVNQRLKIGDVRTGQTATVFYYWRDGAPTVARIVIIKEASQGRPHDK